MSVLLPSMILSHFGETRLIWVSGHLSGMLVERESRRPARMEGATYMSMSPDEYIWEIKQFRHQKDQFFATSPEAPIPARERQQFAVLRYFEPDPAYRVEAELIRFTAPEVVQLGTTTGRISQHYRYGEVRFMLGGQECRLTAYKSV